MKTLILSILCSPILYDLFTGKNIKITARNFDALQTEAFIFGAIIAIVFLLIMWLVSAMIPYEGGSNPQDAKKRRIAYVVIGIIAIIALFMINTFHVQNFITRSGLKSDFTRVNIIGIIIDALVYFVGGFALSKIFKNKSIGTIFPS